MDSRAGEGREAGALVLGLVVHGGGGSDADKQNSDRMRAGNQVEFTVVVAGGSGDVTTNEQGDAGAAVLRDGEAFAGDGVRAEVRIAGGEGRCCCRVRRNCCCRIAVPVGVRAKSRTMEWVV